MVAAFSEFPISNSGFQSSFVQKFVYFQRFDEFFLQFQFSFFFHTNQKFVYFQRFDEFFSSISIEVAEVGLSNSCTYTEASDDVRSKKTRTCKKGQKSAWHRIAYRFWTPIFYLFSAFGRVFPSFSLNFNFSTQIKSLFVSNVLTRF